MKSKDLLLYCRAPGSRGGKSTINTFHGSMTAGALCVCEGFAIVLVFFRVCASLLGFGLLGVTPFGGLARAILCFTLTGSVLRG